MKFLIFICLPVTVASSMPPNVIFNSQMGGNNVLFDDNVLFRRDEESTQFGRAKRQIDSFAHKWPNNTLYFYFDSDIDEKTKRAVRDAHESIQSKTCINFVEDATAENRVRVYKGEGCHSKRGLMDGEQDLSLGKGCGIMDVAAHEFMHALGVWHAHMRSDRDKYLSVDTSRLSKSDLDSYKRLRDWENILNTPYDYGSVMHYPPHWKNETTYEYDVIMRPTDPRYLRTLGSSIISFYDLEMVNDFYGCHEACSAETSAQCQNQGVPNPRNCSECICPSGYGGALCDRRPPGCGAELIATEEWKSQRTKIGWLGVHELLKFCNYWITAPAGSQIEVRITNVDFGLCNYGCTSGGVEAKTEADVRITNPRLCCMDGQFANEVLKSALNPTPVIVYYRMDGYAFDFEYRFVPGPTNTTNATTETVVNSNTPCLDDPKLLGHCLSFKKKGTLPELCDNNKTFAEEHCPRTCGFCTPREGEKQKCTGDSTDCGLNMFLEHIWQAPMTTEEACNRIDKSYEKCQRDCGFCE